jgi:hypothetical protein
MPPKSIKGIWKRDNLILPHGFVTEAKVIDRDQELL